MDASPDQAPMFRFSTAHLPVRDRVAMTREQFGRQMMRLDIEPLDHPFRADFALQVVAGLDIVSVVSSPIRASRTRELVADGDDSFLIQIPRCSGVASQLGREAVLTPGDAVVMSNAETGVFFLPGETQILALRIPHAALVPLLRDAGAGLVRAIPKDTVALRMLVQYVELMRNDVTQAQPALQHLFARHVYDLLSLALGATRDAEMNARGGGLRAARLRAIKADIQNHLADDSLTIGMVTRRQGISESYVRKLFESEDTSFSEYVLNERLVRAYRLLTDPRFAGRLISSVAFEVGFGDLSYFNRAFRRRFGATPSDVRGGSA
jgi:AraC-like DNA-binding protein